VPVSAEGVPVHRGDRLRVDFRWRPGPDGIHPDYALDVVVGSSATPLRWRSPYRTAPFRSSAFYRRLFPAGPDGARTAKLVLA
jgi:hypothetical protein